MKVKDQNMNRNNQKKIFINIIIIAFFFVSGYGLASFTQNYNIKVLNNKITVLNKETESVNLDFSLFWKVWDELEARYLYQDNLEPKKLLYGAIKGMVSSAGDPYTVFFDPEEFSSLKESMASQYEGIGIEMGFENEQIVVITPFEGSPAEKAGIKAGDYILLIGEKTTTAMSLSEAAIEIRGEQGSNVNLTLRHKNEEDSYNVDILRSLITYKTVNLEYKDDDVAYVRISHFADNTTEEWDDVVEEIGKSMVKKIIIDLRNNSGGYVDAATYIAGDFVGRQIVVKQKFTDGSVEEIKSINLQERLKTYEIVVLINEGTASASEILAGCLKDYEVATIIGEKSFGKGIVQDQIPLSEGAGLHVTSSEWLTPLGSSVHEKGIDPDFEIELTEEQIVKGEDSQLNRALEYLK